MKRTQRFHSLAEVQAEKLLLRDRSNANSERLRSHLDTVRDPELRKKLIGNSIQEIIRSSKPLKLLGSIFGSEKGVAGDLLGMALGANGKTMKGKTMGWVAGIALPLLANAFMSSERGGQIVRELGRSWERIRNRLMGEREEV